jgi:hypothetical protein
MRSCATRFLFCFYIKTLYSKAKALFQFLPLPQFRDDLVPTGAQVVHKIIKYFNLVSLLANFKETVTGSLPAGRQGILQGAHFEKQDISCFLIYFKILL